MPITMNESAVYIAKLRPLKRYSYLLMVCLAGIILFFWAGAEFGSIGYIIALTVVLAAFITILIRFNADHNVIVLTEERMLYKQKPDGKAVVLSYAGLQTLKFMHMPKQHSYTKLGFKNKKKYDVTIERPGGFDLKKEEFIAFIFSKNVAVTVTEHTAFIKYKYFMLRGEVRHVEMG